jgi:hypothetical protein
MNGSRRPVRILSRNASSRQEGQLGGQQQSQQPPPNEDPASWPQLDMGNNSSPQVTQPRWEIAVFFLPKMEVILEHEHLPVLFTQGLGIALCFSPYR